MLRSIFYRKDDCAKEYKIGEELGTGSFAVVKRATCRKDGGDWAVKCIDKNKLQKEDEEALKVEVEILETVDHPNIVRLRQIFDCKSMFYMVMELMTGGELFDRIVEKSKYSEKEAAEVVRKVADALQYCHSRGIVHRDLKPENLLYSNRSDEAEIKIADFGLAKLMKESDMMATACGTPGYVAPEILSGNPYTDKVDLWSLGVITYILLCGFPPFYDENNASLFAQIKAGAYDFPSPYWDEVSDDAKDLVRHLLVVDPVSRYSASDVLKHHWIEAGVASARPLSNNAIGGLQKIQATRSRFRKIVGTVIASMKLGKLRTLSNAGAGELDADEAAAGLAGVSIGGAGSR